MPCRRRATTTRLGPSAPRCSQIEAEPGPPLKAKQTGRVAASAPFSRYAVARTAASGWPLAPSMPSRGHGHEGRVHGVLDANAIEHHNAFAQRRRAAKQLVDRLALALGCVGVGWLGRRAGGVAHEVTPGMGMETPTVTQRRRPATGSNRWRPRWRSCGGRRAHRPRGEGRDTRWAARSRASTSPTDLVSTAVDGRQAAAGHTSPRGLRAVETVLAGARLRPARGPVHCLVCASSKKGEMTYPEAPATARCSLKCCIAANHGGGYMDLSKQVAVITGGGSGIGRAVAAAWRSAMWPPWRSST